MKPRTRWLAGEGPDDVDLRKALLDARQGPTEMQVNALAQRVAERAAARRAQSTPPRVSRARPRAAWRLAGIGLATLLLAGVLLWSLREAREEAGETERPAVESASGGAQAAAAPVQQTAAPRPVVEPGHEAATHERLSHASAAASKRRDPRAGPAPRDRAPAALDEVQWLQQARRALFTRPSDALELLRRHREQFPRGAFTEEREAIQVEALWRLRRFDAAEQAWRAFERQYPHSTYRQRLERLRTVRSAE